MAFTVIIIIIIHFSSIDTNFTDGTEFLFLFNYSIWFAGLLLFVFIF